MAWPDDDSALTDTVFSAFAETVLVNDVPHQAIVAREQVVVGDDAAVASEMRWKIYARKADIAGFARHDRIAVTSGKQFRVEAPDRDDGQEVTAWLRGVGNGF